MYLIQPCCAQRNLLRVRDAIKNNGTAQIEGYGDMSLTELLPALLTRYSETETLIAAPTMPDQAAAIISKWMRRQWARADGNGKLDVIRHLTIVADLSEDSSPTVSRWLTECPFGERLTLVDVRQEETAILLPDLAITGPVNMRYGDRFVATITTVQERVNAAWQQFTEVAKAADETEPETETPEVLETSEFPEIQEEPEDADNAPGKDFWNRKKKRRRSTLRR